MSIATDEMSALRGKIMQLELTHRIQRMGQNQRVEKKDLEQKMEKKDLEQKMELSVMEIKMQAVLEKKDLEQKMELMKVQAAINRNEQRTEKKDLEQKMAKKDLEQKMEKKDLEQKMAKKDLEQKMELSVMEIKMQAVLEKKDLEQKTELMKVQAAINRNEQRTEKKDAEQKMALENEKRDREADKIEAQHQIDQLRWEARLGQMEQQLRASYTIQPLTHPAKYPGRANLTQQRESEELVPQRIQLRQLEPREKGTGQRQSVASAAAMRFAAQHSTAASSAPMRSTEASVARPSAMRPVKASVSQQEQHQPATAQSAPSNTPSRNVPQQHHQQVAARPAAVAVPLPGDAHMHFFLSHCQATGGDQTNAIYLELQQLGFSCWYKPLKSACSLFFSICFCSPPSHRYDNRATDLTKDGMRHGIEGAAAFLLFLSEGTLDRPFCECVLCFTNISCVSSIVLIVTLMIISSSSRLPLSTSTRVLLWPVLRPTQTPQASSRSGKPWPSTSRWCSCTKATHASGPSTSELRVRRRR
jgi:hypothetical protein